MVPFRRHIKPKAPTLVLGAGQIVHPDTAAYKILRPRLGFPEAVFTDAAGAHAALVADIATSKADEREPGIPDPDVMALEIVVEVRQLTGDTAPGGYQHLYKTSRTFPAAAAAALGLDLDFDDVGDLTALDAVPPTGPIPIPTARDVRISLTAICGARANYYQSDDHRRGIAPLVLNVRRESSIEADLFDETLLPARYIRGCFFQPDAIEEAPLRAAGLRHEAPSSISGRLAEEIGLVSSGLTLFARKGQRLIVGCSAGLRHVLAPDRSAIQFASRDDLARRWIVVVQAHMLRDWTWDGLEAVAFTVVRVLDGREEEVGAIEIVRAISPVALEKADRSRSHLCFFDAIDPKTEDSVFPSEIDVSYRFEPVFRKAAPIEVPARSLRLPVSTPPLQTPKLTSAGIAFSPYSRSDDYSSTDPRRRSLWVEFEAPARDPLDQYLCRVLAQAPDPLLGSVRHPPDRVREDPLPIDPEPVRVILPGQPEDENGLNAMQLLESAEPQARRFLVPLPPGVTADSPELFGMFTYEFRLGHDARRWSTARGRFGPPLRVTGVQHPAPMLPCHVLRTDTLIETSAPFAQAMRDGRDVVASPNTEMWFMLYAQVREASGAGWRNVLLTRTRGHSPERFREAGVRYSTAAIELRAAAETLRRLALSPESPLSVLAVELIPAPLLGPEVPPNRYADPLGADLGQVRILRSSPLVPVPAAC